MTFVPRRVALFIAFTSIALNIPSATIAQTPRAATRPTARPARVRAPTLGQLMDYGPFLSYSVLPPVSAGATRPASSGIAMHEKLLATRGIVIKVGNDSAVCFDTDMMSLAGGWTGGFLDLSRCNLGRDKGDLPARAKGTLQFGTRGGPGWADSEGSFADPRPDDIGPLPSSWARFHGLYRNGNQIVLSYAIGTMDVLELDGSVADGGVIAFTRTFELQKSGTAHRLLICDDGDQCAVEVIHAPTGATVQRTGGRVELEVPPHAAMDRYKIVIARVGEGGSSHLPGSLLGKAVNVEDLRALCRGGPSLWPEPITTKGSRGADNWAYTVDTVALPEQNPWKSWMRTSAFDFFPDGRAAVCTWNGDVWIVSGLDDKLDHVSWKRFAAGLYEPLGLKIVNNEIYVLGRDQITRLHDLNNDGEADFYENFCNAWPVNPIYHGFMMDLQADSTGNFYFSSCGNAADIPLRMSSYGYILKVPKTGGTYERYANGLRAANGLGMGPHDELVTADNQGNWTPACRINLVKQGGFYGFYYDPRLIKASQKSELHLPDAYDPPICWIRYPSPDNSSGGQVWAGPNWGPLSGKLLTTSYGQSDLMEVMWEQTPDGTPQGGVIKLPLKFASGIMRARVNPKDGQVWVVGLKGWQTNGAKEGALQRVRYTGKPAHLPVALHVMKDGVVIGFSEPVEKASATDEQNYDIEQWNYRWTEQYGSPDYKVSNPSQQGHDEVEIKSVELSADGKSVTLHTQALKPVMQMMIEMHIKAADGAPVDWEIDNTINQVGR